MTVESCLSLIGWLGTQKWCRPAVQLPAVACLAWFLPFFTIQHQWSLHCGQWHSKQGLENSEPGSISSELEALQIPAGLWGRVASCPLYRYPLVTPRRIIWSQPEMFSVEERFPATGPLWVDHMSLPVGLCGLASGNILTPTLHASSPPYACGYQGW